MSNANKEDVFDRCQMCGGFRVYHHDFVTGAPTGCVCPEDQPELSPICKHFHGDDAAEKCWSCGHLLKCHEP